MVLLIFLNIIGFEGNWNLKKMKCIYFSGYIITIIIDWIFKNGEKLDINMIDINDN